MTTFRSYGEAIAATRSALADAGFIHTNGRGWKLSGYVTGSRRTVTA